MASNSYNLVSIEKIDEALNYIDSLSGCDISGAMSALSFGDLSAEYSGIANGIFDIKESINGLENGEGPEKLIYNYKAAYNDIRTAIIQACGAENGLGFDNGTVGVGCNFIKVNGQEGYLYIPEGYSPTANLPLVTWYAGSGETGKNAIKNKGLPYILDDGYKMDAVVWCPVSYTSYNNETQYNTIKTIVDTYNLDENRVSLFGYSLGAATAYNLVRDNPNYFSTVVTYGIPSAYKDVQSSDTTFIMYQGKNDRPTDAQQTYEGHKNNGNQVMFYRLQDASHYDVDAMLTDKMISDAINIQKGEKFSNVPDDVIEVQTEAEGRKRVIADNGQYTRLCADNSSSSSRENNISGQNPITGGVSKETTTQVSNPSVTTSVQNPKTGGVNKETTAQTSNPSATTSVQNPKAGGVNRETTTQVSNPSATTSVQNPKAGGVNRETTTQTSNSSATTSVQNPKTDGVNRETTTQTSNPSATTSAQNPKAGGVNRETTTQTSNPSATTSAQNPKIGGVNRKTTTQTSNPSATTSGTTSVGGSTTTNVANKVTPTQTTNSGTTTSGGSITRPYVDDYSSSKDVYDNLESQNISIAPSKVNILEGSNFNDALPNLTGGQLKTMEIGKSLVKYSVDNMNEKNYADYIQSLKDFGYTFHENKWIKDNYEVTIDYNDNNLNIQIISNL